MPEPDHVINGSDRIVDDVSATYAAIRAEVSAYPILHAIISCKWTLRSDRAQNARSEALNLVKNRKGRLPHIMVVSDRKNPDGQPLVIHNIGSGVQEEDRLFEFKITGHYRIKSPGLVRRRD